MSRTSKHVFTVIKRLDDMETLKLKMSGCHVVGAKVRQYHPWFADGARREAARRCAVLLQKVLCGPSVPRGLVLFFCSSCGSLRI